MLTGRLPPCVALPDRCWAMVAVARTETRASTKVGYCSTLGILGVVSKTLAGSLVPWHRAERACVSRAFGIGRQAWGRGRRGVGGGDHRPARGSAARHGTTADA